VVGLWFIFVGTPNNACNRDLNDFFKNKLLTLEVTKTVILWDLTLIVYLEIKIEPQMTGMHFLLYSSWKMLCSYVKSRK